MEGLIQQEQFELEVLERLNSKRLLNSLVFGGETMLRLCFGLNRFSVDLDFWLVKALDRNKIFSQIKTYLSQYYTLRDSADKFHTLLLEIKSTHYPRSLKIAIRKEPKKIKTEQAIAYSKYSNRQVILRVVSLEEMMKAKLQALLERREIRDAFDIEFLLRRGIKIGAAPQTLKKAFQTIEAFTKNDYTVKLGSLLGEPDRRYYLSQDFKILKTAIKERLFSLPREG